jgi:A/G-specific adenine glycosylase
MNFSNKLINWYQIHKRALPWRETTHPYFIWLSEIILQQTRVSQGLPYYLKFVAAFPTVQELAAAPQEYVLKLWQGLGYYSRARNLQFAALQIVENGGIFPNNFKDLLNLKGVGEYTAAAIASFAYGESVAVVDGNVYRVLSRIYGIALPINSTEGIKEFKKVANELIDPQNAALHNQAIMELGALQCVPKNPDCTVCPFQKDCVAFNEHRIGDLPVKIKKTKVLSLFHHYLVTVTPSGHTVLQERAQTGIWAGLYEFPYVESNGALLPHELTGSDAFKEVFKGVRFRESVYNQEPIIHKLSHRKIHAYFWIIQTEAEVDGGMSIAAAKSKPLHVLMERFMTEFWSR